jgi:hypothetical protein
MQRQMDGWQMNDLEGSDRDLTEVLFRHFLRGVTEQNQENPATVADVLDEIRTDHLPNGSHKAHRYANRAILGLPQTFHASSRPLPSRSCRTYNT